MKKPGIMAVIAVGKPKHGEDIGSPDSLEKPGKMGMGKRPMGMKPEGEEDGAESGEQPDLAAIGEKYGLSPAETKGFLKEAMACMMRDCGDGEEDEQPEVNESETEDYPA